MKPIFFTRNSHVQATSIAASAACAISMCICSLIPLNAQASSANTPWQWPTGHPVHVIEDFRPPTFRWLAGNRGVVLDVSEGETIHAPASGIVTTAGRIVDRDVVAISHDHRRSTFEPLKPLVTVGQYVHIGDPIGIVSVGPNGPLHWGVKIDSSTYLHPLQQLLGGIVLKPWDAPADK